MVGVPYTALALFGFLVYRGCKKNAEYRAQLESGSATPPDPPASAEQQRPE